MMTVLPDTASFLTADLRLGFRAPLRPGPTEVLATVHGLTRRQATVEVVLSQGGSPTSRATVEQVMVRRPAAAVAGVA